LEADGREARARPGVDRRPARASLPADAGHDRLACAAAVRARPDRPLVAYAKRWERITASTFIAEIANATEVMAAVANTSARVFGSSLIPHNPRSQCVPRKGYTATPRSRDS